MRLNLWTLVATLSIATRSLAAPVLTVHPGNAGDLTISAETTINGTRPLTNATRPAIDAVQATEKLPLTFTNNFAGNINAYVTGLNSQNEIVILQPDGSWYTPTGSYSTPNPITANIAIPVGGLGSKVEIALPGYISSARIWFAAGELKFFLVNDGNGNPSLVEPSASNPEDPSAGVSWGFVELTNTEEGGLYANISYVDFVGLPLGMSMVAGDGSVQSTPGLQAGAVTSICNDLQAQAAKDGQPWDQLCQVDSSGNPLRITAPPDFIAVNPNAWAGYYDDYINEVWTKYTTQKLIINTQGSAGNVSCQVSGDVLSCAGAGRDFSKPSVNDIWGCNSGPFGIKSTDNGVYAAIVPRLCAAFDRTTLCLDGGDVQPNLPASSYYTIGPTNWYSAIVHKYEIQNKGYAFCYDDVNPDGDENASGVVVNLNPQSLSITIGGS
ncbi:glycoside hydrolase family 64 protein [Myriangium duriaei CBS 260.36]|uniref:Glycoside hydrolase family 64 protein n=1 Tax=Myriangium duriaei CBS 260.36 TaxID=1168546 RepID=A0A9P4MDF4_9PEZI|nr:glycoside hydrolase family 64 protein [Myriangium duriaei CBS 260.36]